MELLKTSTQIVKMVESVIQTNDNSVVIVKDYYDESDKIIDTEIRDENGYSIEDPAEVEEILEFLDSQE